MYFEEKIELLKRRFSESELKIPFTNGSEILKKIERAFVKQKAIDEDLNNIRSHLTNWARHLKTNEFLQAFKANELASILGRLESDKNYWIVLNLGNHSNSKQYVYDCRPIVMPSLIALGRYDFFIVDKKYDWLLYLHFKGSKEQFELYKGSLKCPFC